MTLFHKEPPQPARPFPAGIPAQYDNFEKLRYSINFLIPLVHEQQTSIQSHDNLPAISEHQEQIHSTLIRSIWAPVRYSHEPWLREFNDVRVSMEMKGIQAQRRKDDVTGKGPFTEQEERKLWYMYLENYEYLLYLLNRLLKALADYEHGTWWWIDQGNPIPEPPFPVGRVKFVEKLDDKVNDNEEDGDQEKKPKQVQFDKRVHGWFFHDDDTPSTTSRGTDAKSRKKAAFVERLVENAKSSSKALVQQVHEKKRKNGGYFRCYEGFGAEKPRGLPDRYRLWPYTRGQRASMCYAGP